MDEQLDLFSAAVVVPGNIIIICYHVNTHALSISREVFMLNYGKEKNRRRKSLPLLITPIVILWDFPVVFGSRLWCEWGAKRNGFKLGRNWGWKLATKAKQWSWIKETKTSLFSAQRWKMMAEFYKIISRRLPFIKYNFFISLEAEDNIPLHRVVRKAREMEKSSVDVFINCWLLFLAFRFSGFFMRWKMRKMFVVDEIYLHSTRSLNCFWLVTVEICYWRKSSAGDVFKRVSWKTNFQVSQVKAIQRHRKFSINIFTQ